MPKYMKDESGYCYAWTETLSTQKHLSAYDGDVDAGGFATDKPAKTSKTAKGVKPAAPETDTAVVDPLDVALAEAKLD